MSDGPERPGCPLRAALPNDRSARQAGRGFALPIAVLALVAVAVSAGSVGWLVVRQYDAFLVAREVDRLGEGVRNQGGRIQAGIDAMRQDTLFLAGVPAVEGIVRARRAGGVDPDSGRLEAYWRNRVAETFSGLARAKPHYLQIRFIGVADGGREVVRVDREDGPVRTTAPEALQAKGDRPYFKEAVTLGRGEVYVSPLELNQEQGQIDPRMIRVVRVSTPVYDPDGGLFGAVVVNVDFGRAMAGLWAAESGDEAAFVTDHRGVPLLTLGNAGADLFGPPLQARPIQAAIDGAAGLFDADGPMRQFSGQVGFDGSDQIAYLQKVGLDQNHPDRFITIGALIPRDTVMVPIKELHQWALGIALFASGLLLAAMVVAGIVLARTRRQVRQGDVRLEAVLERAPDGIIVVGRNGEILRANARMEALSGYGRAELVGHLVENLVPEQCRTAHVGYRDGYFAAPETRPMMAEGGLLLQRKDGTDVPVEISLAPIYDGDSETTIAVVRDITERVRMEEEVRRFMHQLETSNKELDDFAYIASHDLKEPLRGIHHYATFLLEDYADRLDADGSDKLRTLTRLTQRMEDLINDLLTFSRLGRVDLAQAETDLDALVRDLLESLEVTLNERHCRVVISTPLPVVHCDRVRVREVFGNLIANASKYNESPEPLVEVGVSSAGNGEAEAQGGVVFHVRDNGIGIPERHQEAIFNIFKRLHGRDKYGSGTGAGLTIVKKIVEQHGGRIWLESAPGKGTTFFFTLTGEQTQ